MGYGDEIMTTGFVKLAKQKYPEAQIIIGDKKSGYVYDHLIFNNNPKITKSNFIDPEQQIWLESFPGKRPYIKSYDSKKIIWNDKFRAIKGEIYFDNNELSFAKNELLKIRNKSSKKIIFIEPSPKKNTDFKKQSDNNIGKINKRWDKNKWQELIYELKNKFVFIQNFHEQSIKYHNCNPLKSSFREACSVLNLCDGFVGWEGGLSHAAAALNKKAVVLFGGFISPKLTGYELHENIYVDIKGSPCGKRDYCNHCEKCRNIITVEEVKKRLNKIFL